MEHAIAGVDFTPFKLVITVENETEAADLYNLFNADKENSDYAAIATTINNQIGS